MIRTDKLFALATATIVLSGCASVFNSGGSDSYGCPGMPSGVVCKTPAAVYKSSNGELPQTEFDIPIKNADDSSASASSNSRDTTIRTTATNMAGAPPMMPLREPPKMMRIWFAPWVDKNDMWHSASYQVVEVVGRKWATGVPEANSAPIVTPYLSSQKVSSTSDAPAKPTTPQKATASANTSVNAQGGSPGNFDLNAGLPAAR